MEKQGYVNGDTTESQASRDCDDSQRHQSTRGMAKSAPCSPHKGLRMQVECSADDLQSQLCRSDSFHVIHKVPAGDTPYVRAKHVQLVDKDPDRAIALFWAAINAGDRVDSALKDMAIVMKQQNRSEEAIEAIKSLRGRCSNQAQESLDNVLLDLYKRCGRLDDQISLLKHKILMIHQGTAFKGKRTKTARSQGKKIQVSIEQEATRLLGNLGWAYMQKGNFGAAEAVYRKALAIEPDNNKVCNLGICLMKQGRLEEAKSMLEAVSPSGDLKWGSESHLKSYERAQEVLKEVEASMTEAETTGNTQVIQSTPVDLADLGLPDLWDSFGSNKLANQQQPLPQMRGRNPSIPFKQPPRPNVLRSVSFSGGHLQSLPSTRGPTPPPRMDLDYSAMPGWQGSYTPSGFSTPAFEESPEDYLYLHQNKAGVLPNQPPPDVSWHAQMLRSRLEEVQKQTGGNQMLAEPSAPWGSLPPSLHSQYEGQHRGYSTQLGSKLGSNYEEFYPSNRAPHQNVCKPNFEEERGWGELANSGVLGASFKEFKAPIGLPRPLRPLTLAETNVVLNGDDGGVQKRNRVPTPVKESREGSRDYSSTLSLGELCSFESTEKNTFGEANENFISGSNDVSNVSVGNLGQARQSELEMKRPRRLRIFQEMSG